MDTVLSVDRDVNGKVIYGVFSVILSSIKMLPFSLNFQTTKTESLLYHAANYPFERCWDFILPIAISKKTVLVFFTELVSPSGRIN